MFISKIKINNFRNFKDQEVVFNDGVNVIIGHNNAGKTNLLKALALVINPDTNRRLDVDDFNKNTDISTLKTEPPKIRIQVTIKKGSHETADDLVTISNWLTKLESEYEAQLTYDFFLPEKELQNYTNALAEVNDTNDLLADRNLAWKIIKNDFIRLYTYKIWGGNLDNQTVADGESLSRFDFQFLDAIRDVERDMLTGKNTLLRNVFDFFMDYDIKSIKGKDIATTTAEIKERKSKFSTEADYLISALQKRMAAGKDEILSYAKETGASFNGAVPTFEGSISDVEMFSALKLIIEYKTGIKVPATHNGLGYNNLIYMSLLLAKMQVNSDGTYMGSNAKVFATLAIEEPEAHLHPAMQYKFLKFLKNNREQRKVRQIFVTTHSTHITSAVGLDEIICLHNENGETKVGYPSNAFPEDGKSKAYVQRFLDATKSDMLFAQKVIFVEGLAEQLLISIFAQYLGKSLEDHHIAVINVGGRYFDHFLHLFNIKNPNAIGKKVACITDKDPERRLKLAHQDDDKQQYFNKCYPFEYHATPALYKYQKNSIPTDFSASTNISFFMPEDTFGKTLEYELARSNPSCDLLLTDKISNREEIKDLMTLFSQGKDVTALLDRLGNSKENTRIKTSINGITDKLWTDDEKKKAIIAARYLNSVGKGENALELSRLLLENIEKNDSLINFNVPTYIKEAIDFICQ